MLAGNYVADDCFCQPSYMSHLAAHCNGQASCSVYLGNWLNFSSQATCAPTCTGLCQDSLPTLQGPE